MLVNRVDVQRAVSWLSTCSTIIWQTSDIKVIKVSHVHTTLEYT